MALCMQLCRYHASFLTLLVIGKFDKYFKMFTPYQPVSVHSIISSINSVYLFQSIHTSSLHLQISVTSILAIIL